MIRCKFCVKDSGKSPPPFSHTALWKSLYLQKMRGHQLYWFIVKLWEGFWIFFWKLIDSNYVQLFEEYRSFSLINEIPYPSCFSAKWMMNSARSLSARPKWLSSSVQIFETSERCSSFFSSSMLMFSRRFFLQLKVEQPSMMSHYEILLQTFLFTSNVFMNIKNINDNLSH